MSTSGRAPAKHCVCKTPSGNPLPRRGQVKESIAKHIVAAAVATASALVCDAGGKKAGAAKPPAAPAATGGDLGWADERAVLPITAVASASATATFSYTSSRSFSSFS
ncbi:hypothetical protein ZWY2020_047157 [Hordeum vulgare]|nr:hypothetical protein ZWY2020_047157 [Hordeum vulgare]